MARKSDNKLTLCTMTMMIPEYVTSSQKSGITSDWWRPMSSGGRVSTDMMIVMDICTYTNVGVLFSV